MPLVLTAAAALLTAGCTDATSPTSNRTVHSLAVRVGAATDVPDPPDFIKSSRKGDADYMAVGITPPDRKLQPRKGDDVKKLENELESTRSQHDRLAGRKPPAKPAKKKPPAAAAQ
jgi:hypothetical protein